MRICKDNKQKTAFKTQYGYFKYQVIVFGLSNTLAIFQEYLNKILAEKFDIFVIINLDDILIYTKDLGQPYIEAVYWVLDQLRKYFLFANRKKCWFHQNEIYFLRYIVLSKSISINAEKIEVVKEQLKPKLIQDIQTFLSFVYFYQQFIQNFSKIAAPLISILKITML